MCSRTLESLRKQTLQYASRAKSRGEADPVVPKSVGVGGNPLMERLLDKLRPRLETLIGRRLYPTYAYFRVYNHGASLARHTDRPACEISLSLCIGYEGNENWPLYVEGPQGVFAARLEPGDGLLYRGIDCPHWRECLTGQWASQVFLHYVDRDGPHKALRFDKRSRVLRWLVGLRAWRPWQL